MASAESRRAYVKLWALRVAPFHFIEKEAFALIRIKNQMTSLVLRIANMTRHKTQARAFTMPVVIGSSSLHGIKEEVVVRTCRSIIVNRVDHTRSRSY
jgi:hypothetical protein